MLEFITDLEGYESVVGVGRVEGPEGLTRTELQERQLEARYAEWEKCAAVAAWQKACTLSVTCFKTGVDLLVARIKARVYRPIIYSIPWQIRRRTRLVIDALFDRQAKRQAAHSEWFNEVRHQIRG